VKRERGFALLIVLWTMGLLALLVGQYIATGRTEVRIAANLRSNSVIQAAADGALHEAVLRLLQGAWTPNARARRTRVSDTAVELSILDQSWKVNPNLASAPVLRALFRNLGLSADKAAVLADAIVEWRSPNPRTAGPLRPRTGARSSGASGHLFGSVDEIGMLAAMTPGLLARMKPYMSVYPEPDALETSEALPTSLGEMSAVAGDGWHLGSSGRVMLVLMTRREAASPARQWFACERIQVSIRRRTKSSPGRPRRNDRPRAWSRITDEVALTSGAVGAKRAQVIIMSGALRRIAEQIGPVPRVQRKRVALKIRTVPVSGAARLSHQHGEPLLAGRVGADIEFVQIEH
jgi:general secretion pathway protein K